MSKNSHTARKETPPRRLTMRDLAKLAGVSHPVVSAVLNENYSSVKVSQATRQRVLRVIREKQYYRNALGRALSKNRTGHIGFLLSDTIADGWSNILFSQAVSGVEEACRQSDYGLTIRRYNLSNIDSFVFPRRVGERSVDGLVLCGYVEAVVVQRFQEFGIPCVCIGDNLEVAGMIPTVASDIVDGLYQATAYAVGMGHARIVYCNEATRRGREVGRLLVERVGASAATSRCRVQTVDFPGGKGNYNDAPPLMEYWSACSKEDRPSAVICSDQTAMAFLFELFRRNLQCPRDVSVISTCDSKLNELTPPPLTSIHYDMEEYGLTAARLLLEHLNQNKPLGREHSRVESCTLVIRQSVGPVETVSQEE